MQTISINALGKKFGDTELFSDISFSVDKGEIVAIFGPNGSGKTTLLNIISGITEKTTGEVDNPFLNNNQFSYIFQSYKESLFPWKNNYENIAFPLLLHGKKNSEVKKKVEELDKIFGLGEHFGMFPYELSGGQQQIVAFIRALVSSPKALFIDEPFSALDYENNLKLRENLLDYHSKYLPTILIVTHNIEEAVHLANKIIVLSKKPTKIVDIIENSATYPRKLSYLKSKEFLKVKEKVLEAFQKGADQ